MISVSTELIGCYSTECHSALSLQPAGFVTMHALLNMAVAHHGSTRYSLSGRLPSLVATSLAMIAQQAVSAGIACLDVSACQITYACMPQLVKCSRRQAARSGTAQQLNPATQPGY